MLSHPPIAKETSSERLEGYISTLEVETPEERWGQLLERLDWSEVIHGADPRADMESAVAELREFATRYRDSFEIEVGPVRVDIVEDHLENHFNSIDSLVTRDVIRPLDALTLAELVYLYDLVLPSLAEERITPTFEGRDLRILLTPPPLYDWMFDLDVTWTKLEGDEVLDRETLRKLRDSREDFVKEAKSLKAFTLVPPPTDSVREGAADIRTRWFRHNHVESESIHEYVYSKMAKLDALTEEAEP